MATKKEIKEQEDWMTKKWRPAMGWMYMAVCITDFTLFPILWSLLQAVSHGQVTSQWQPLTLQGAGLFHLAMGAVLGVAAWSRGQEKMAGVTGVSTNVMGGGMMMNSISSSSSFESQVPIMPSSSMNISKPAKKSISAIDPDAVLERG